MSGQSSPNRWRQNAIGISLIAFFVAVYFLTFDGYASISRDEWFQFDATESMARRGDLRVNYEFDAYPPLSLDQATPPPADTEPLQPVLTAPLFLIAQALPGIGMAHTVWLFNVLVTALMVGTFYAYGLALGYSLRVALLTAGVFGLGTIIWPYSRTLFREPLFTLLAFLSAYLLLRTRRQFAAGKRPFLTLIAFAITLIGVLFSKEAAFLILPALVIEAFPVQEGRIRPTLPVILPLAGVAVVGLALVFLALNASTVLGLDLNRYALLYRAQHVQDNLSGMSDGLKGYLFSPARSLWVFSPVLLLGLAGCWRLMSERRWRQIVMPPVMLATFIVGYAAGRGPEWYGGTGWGARYLVPVTPFLALWLLPVAQSLLGPGAAWWKRLGAALVFALSAGIQLLPVLVPVKRYGQVLAAQQPPIIAWNEGAWSLRWSPIRISLDLLGDQKADLAWQYATSQAWLLPAASVILALVALGWLVWWNRRRDGTWLSFTLTTGSLVMGAVLALGVGLYGIRLDPRYYGDFRPTRDLLSALTGQARPDDVIVLNDDTYAEFFMNYYRLSRPVVYTLPKSPGERASPEQLPQIESSNPDDLIHHSDTIILTNLAAQHGRLWLVINSSPFITWSVRPVEHYLARHYFPIGEIKATDTARAVLFDTTPAPPATAPLWPEHRVDAVYSGSVQLVGYDIPGGTMRHPGDVLPVSLVWQALGAVPQDYTVGLFLMSPDGRLLAQRDSYPLNSFEPMGSWRPGSLHRDNHGLQLPPDIPPGTYELWAVLYWWQAPADRLTVTDAHGGPLGDHVVLTTVVIQP